MMIVSREVIRDRAIDTGAMFIRRLEGVIAWGSVVGNPPVFDTSLFPWAGGLEVAWESIRAELDAVLEQPESIPPFQELSRDQRRLTDDEGWRTYFFYAFGFKAERNCDRCPETARLLETIPGMTSAFFSIFSPGKRLPDHRGAFKGLIRYHLGLLVPCPDACGIRVDNQICHWQQGQSLIFDDTYRHEAWNESDQPRVVLFVDFKRPLRFPANLLNWFVLQLIKHSPFVKDSIANYNAWEERLDHVS
jgi:ornithine lipid ester-linked acyl 2-hydroxylase